MSVLVVADPWSGPDPAVDATVGLAAAAQHLDVPVWVCTPEDLAVVDGRVRAQARRIVLGPRRRGGDHRWLVRDPWFRVEHSRVLDVAGETRLVLARTDPPVDPRYLATTHLLDLVEAAGTRVVNRPSGIRALHEKLLPLHAGDLTPTTLVTSDPAAVRRAVADLGAAVVKPLDGFAGVDVWLLRDDDAALPLAESATGHGRRHVVVQEYLPAVREGNKRLFLLDGRVIGAVLRDVADGDFRIGPPSRPAAVTDADRRMVRRLAPTLAAHGIALAGLDVIDDRLIEVNLTCPGGTAKADALLGTDLSGVIMRHLLHHLPATTAPTAARPTPKVMALP